MPVYKKGESHKFTGKRISRGLYQWSKGIINADLNGAIGIIKKVVPEALDSLIEIRNRGTGFAPFKVVPEALDSLIEIRNRGTGFAPFKVVNIF